MFLTPINEAVSMQFEFGKYGKHDEIGEFPEKICSSGDCGTSNKPPNKLEI